jgi:hypothetical protein
MIFGQGINFLQKFEFQSGFKLISEKEKGLKILFTRWAQSRPMTWFHCEASLAQ